MKLVVIDGSFSVGLLASSGESPLSWTSPMFPKLYSNDSEINPLGKPITEAEDAWIASLVSIGALIGPLFIVPVTERWGRKPGILCIAVPIIVSYFLSAFAKVLYILYVSRLVIGASCGAMYALLPNYVAEISEDNNRGRNSQMINVFWASGNFFVYAVGPFMRYQDFNILLGCVPALFFVLFIVFAPESPYYLVGKNKLEDAKKSIRLLRSKDEDTIEDEINIIRKGLKEEEKASFMELIMDSTIRRTFLICLVLVLAQDLCGFTAILFYMQMIFEGAGMSLSSDICSVIVSIFILTTSFISPFFVDRSGRRILTIISSFGMCASLGVLGAYFYVDDVPSSLSWIPLASLVLYILAFNFGISSVPYTLISELFPTKIKNTISTAVPTIGWAVSFLITNSFNSMNRALGHAGTFWIFAGASFIIGVFSMLFVPETKGKSFSEIQDMLETQPTIQIFIKKSKMEKVKSPV